MTRATDNADGTVPAKSQAPAAAASDTRRPRGPVKRAWKAPPERMREPYLLLSFPAFLMSQEVPSEDPIALIKDPRAKADLLRPEDAVVLGALMSLAGLSAKGFKQRAQLHGVPVGEVGAEAGTRSDATARSLRRLRSHGAVTIDSKPGLASVATPVPAKLQEWYQAGVLLKYRRWLRAGNVSPSAAMVCAYLVNMGRGRGTPIETTRQQLADRLHLGLAQIDGALAAAKRWGLVAVRHTRKPGQQWPLLAIEVLVADGESPPTAHPPTTKETRTTHPETAICPPRKADLPNPETAICPPRKADLPTQKPGTSQSSRVKESAESSQQRRADPWGIVVGWLREQARTPGRLTGDQVLVLMRALDPDTSAIRSPEAVAADNRQAAARVADWAQDAEVLAQWLTLANEHHSPQSLVGYLRTSSRKGDPSTLLRQHSAVVWPQDLQDALSGRHKQNIESLTATKQSRFESVPRSDIDTIDRDYRIYALVEHDRRSNEEVASIFGIRELDVVVAVQRHIGRQSRPRERGTLQLRSTGS